MRMKSTSPLALKRASSLGARLRLVLAVAWVTGFSACGGGGGSSPPPGFPLAVLSALNLNFSSQLVGTASGQQPVTLSNTGNAPLAIASISISNGFSQANNCGAQLAAGAQCQIQVTFSPATAGAIAGTLTIQDNSTSGSQAVSLGGTGIDMTVSPVSLSFPASNVGTSSASQTVMLTNLGASSLTIFDVSTAGDFTESDACMGAVAAGASCALQVTFNPTTGGARGGELAIRTNDFFPLDTVGLSGMGVAPSSEVNVTPAAASVTFTQSQQFAANVTVPGGSTVSWSVDGVPGGDATVGTISASGLYTPPAAPGSHKITATSSVDPTQIGTAMVVVTNLAGVFSYHVDAARLGLNSSETVLNTANVNSVQFGKLFSYQVDGQVYAEPLYVRDLSFPGQGFHNAVFVATEHDSVYAFDADGLAPNPLWQVSFINPAAGVTTVPSADVGANDIFPEIGVTSTPVIDPVNQILYVEAKTKEVSGANTSYVHRLHALALATGTEALGGPVVIQATVKGTGDGSDPSGNLPFLPLRQMNRPGLLLQNGAVYLAFGSHGDNDPYHGWLLGYGARTLQQVSVFNVTPNGSRGAIWQSGGGPSGDSSGNIYFLTGNGTFDADTGGTDFGDSLLKLSTGTGGTALADYFTPFDQANLEATDADLGSGAPILLPDQPPPHVHLAIAAGKGGTIYLVNRDAMGHFHVGDDSQIVQSVPGALASAFDTPAYFQSAIYYLAVGDTLKAFVLEGGLLSASPISQSTMTFGYPGATPAVSANGTSEGIVWALETDAASSGGPVVLHAFFAEDVGLELYNSAQQGSRDQAGPAVKFTVPTVANGKVYIGTASELDVYGLLP